MSKNTMELPSGIQLGLTALNSGPGSKRGVPPSAEITYRRAGCSGSPPEKAICFPSGDHRGKKAPPRSRGGQLQFLGSVNPAAPQNAIGISHIGKPVPIGRKADVGNRRTVEVRKELARLGVVPNQLGPRLFANSVDPFPVSAWLWAIKAHRPRGQPHRTMVHLMKQIAFLAGRPEIHPILSEDLKDEVPSVRRPAPFLVKSSSQLRKNAVQVAATGGELPE